MEFILQQYHMLELVVKVEEETVLIKMFPQHLVKLTLEVVVVVVLDKLVVLEFLLQMEALE